MTIKGMVYDDKKAAGERLLLARQEMPNADMMLLGTYRGFELNIRFDSFKNEHQAVLRAELSYPVSLGDDARGNITRLDNAIDNFADRIADAENALQNLEQPTALPMLMPHWILWNSRSRPQRSKWQSPLHRRKNWSKSLPALLN